MISLEISDKTDLYDNGFLRRHISQLEPGRPETRISQIEMLCPKFCNENDKVIPYHQWCGWNVSNYSYENIFYTSLSKAIVGKMYHITGNDGTQKDGDDGYVLSLIEQTIETEKSMRNYKTGVLEKLLNKSPFFSRPKQKFIDTILTPLMLDGELEGFHIKQKYINGENYSDEMILGDSHSLVEMPKFRGRNNNKNFFSFVPLTLD